MIKLAYEWIGPAGPISNNNFPNFYDIKLQYNGDVDYDYFAYAPNLKDCLQDMYDVNITSVSSIKESDFFLYEINIDYKQAFVFDSFYISNVNRRIRNILNDNNSLGYYALNLCLEGWCDDHFLYKLYDMLRKNKINTSKVILFNGSVNAKELHDQWARRNGIESPIKVVTRNIYHRLSKQRINNKKSRSKKFLCFNRRWKPHRLLLYVYLHKNKLLEHFYFSLPKTNVTDSSDSFHKIVGDLINRYALDISTEDIHAAYDDLPLVLDDDDFERLNWWSNNKLNQYHTDSYISIINETMFEEREAFPTEKTYRTMSFAHPFIVLGTSGFLQGIRSLGFKTFSDTIDESYDSITNNSDRIKYQLSMIKDMCNWPESKFEELITNTQTVRLHNYHLLSTNIPNEITMQQLGKIYDNR